jgi:hypothetical protein
MKKIALCLIIVGLLASCGGKKIELDANYPGTFFSFSYPSLWKVTSQDSQAVLEQGSNSALFRFIPLDNAKKNDLSSIDDMINGYMGTVDSSGMASDRSEPVISQIKTVWIDSTSASLKSIAFFMPIDGGVYTGQMSNVSDAEFVNTTKEVFRSFLPKSVPLVKEPVLDDQEFITHDGDIYTISFPKSWTISGDNPMIIKGSGKQIEISTIEDSKAIPGKLDAIGLSNGSEVTFGNVRAMLDQSADKTGFIYSFQLFKKIMRIKAIGFTATNDTTLDRIIRTFKYFPEKDNPGQHVIVEPLQKNIDPDKIKPVENVNIPTPNNTPKPVDGEPIDAPAYSLMLPKDWTNKSTTATITSFFPPNYKDSSDSYIDIVVQAFTYSAMDEAKAMIEEIAPGTKIIEIDVAGTKAAQFTIGVGSTLTVQTIVTKGEHLFMIVYHQGKQDLRSDYAAILRTFEPK